MYLTFTFHRHEGHALGWTAVGPGTVMQGSLMFIVCGDPRGNEAPLVSIRTATGYVQPRLLNQSDMVAKMDLRVIRSSWLPDDDSPGSYSAMVSLVCYSCHDWPSTDISASSRSQPWICAWNAKQEFDLFSFDAHFLMHKHHAGAGGWGNHYLDMRRSINTAHLVPSLPPVRPDIAVLGASDRPMSLTGTFTSVAIGAGSFLHGMLLAGAFLLVVPAGVVALRSGSPRSFTLHWIFQLSASVLLLVGSGLGLLKSDKINTKHQWVGISLLSSIGVQGLFGWWHHKLFVRLRRRTWVSYLHLWLGRAVMIGRCGNVVSGLFLRGCSKSSAIVVTVIVFVCLEVVGLNGWSWWVTRKRAKQDKHIAAWSAIADESNFALTAMSEDDDEDDSSHDEDDKDDAVGESLLKRPDKLAKDEH